jgi:TMEM175 potassium channel family protein
MPEQAANPLTEARETGRLAAFSDGVFAIAITLLVLELKVPNLETAGSSPAALGRALLQQWPSYGW